MLKRYYLASTFCLRSNYSRLVQLCGKKIHVETMSQDTTPTTTTVPTETKTTVNQPFETIPMSQPYTYDIAIIDAASYEPSTTSDSDSNDESQNEKEPEDAPGQPPVQETASALSTPVEVTVTATPCDTPSTSDDNTATGKRPREEDNDDCDNERKSKRLRTSQDDKKKYVSIKFIPVDETMPIHCLWLEKSSQTVEALNKMIAWFKSNDKLNAPLETPKQDNNTPPLSIKSIDIDECDTLTEEQEKDANMTVLYKSLDPSKMDALLSSQQIKEHFCEMIANWNNQSVEQWESLLCA